MYVHLGGELVLPVNAVVAVLDARTLPGSAVNEELLRRAQAAGRLRGGPVGPQARALVVTREGVVYVSTVAARTLSRRMTRLRRRAGGGNAET